MDIHCVILKTQCSLPTTLSKDNNSILQDYFDGSRDWTELGDVIYNVAATDVNVGYNVTEVTNQTSIYYLLIFISSKSVGGETIIKVLSF